MPTTCSTTRRVAIWLPAFTGVIGGLLAGCSPGWDLHHMPLMIPGSTVLALTMKFAS